MNDIFKKISQNKINKKECTEEEKKEFREILESTRKELEKRNTEVFKKSITVKELFEKVTFHDVFEYLKEYGNDEEHYEYFKEIFELIKEQNDNETKNFICMKEIKNEAPDVYSMQLNQGTRYSLMLSKYEEIANYRIHPETTEKFVKEEIVAGFLEEFSWSATDELKEEYKESLEESTKEIEKYRVQEEAKEQGIIPIFQEEVARPMIISREETAEEKAGETIREYAQEVSYKEVMDALEEQFGYIEDELKVDKQETIKIVQNNFFSIKKKINETPIKKNGYTIRATFLENQLEVNAKDKKQRCYYSGESVYEILDERFKRKVIFKEVTKAEAYANFIIALLKQEILKNEIDKEESEEYIERIKIKKEEKRIIEKASKGISSLTFEELVKFSYSMEHINSMNFK